MIDFNLLFFYLWFVLAGLLIVKLIILAISKRLRKKDKVSNKIYELDILDQVVENSSSDIINSYFSNTSELITKYFIYKRNDNKTLGIKFNEVPDVKNVLVYEYNNKKRLINVIHLNSYNFNSDGIELELNKNTEFVNIVTNNNFVKIKNKKYSIFNVIYDSAIFSVLTLIISNIIVTYNLGNLSATFFDDKINLLIVLSILFVISTIYFLTIVYFKRNKHLRRVNYEWL